jgi:hypothetical protein
MFCGYVTGVATKLNASFMVGFCELEKLDECTSFLPD